jgi:histidine decarboxylase
MTAPDPAWLDEAASLLSGKPVDLEAVLDGLLAQRAAQLERHFFYPVATDIDFRPLADFYAKIWNNIGSRHSSPPGGNHTKAAERAVLAWAAALFDFPDAGWWGNITTGGTAGNRAGLLAARDLLPAGAVTYYSAGAHYSVPKILHELAMPAVQVYTDQYGEMIYDHLAEVLDPTHPAIVNATAGTTMTEAVDDVARINTILDVAGTADRYVHVDAALSGIPLALDGNLWTEGVHSIAISGYKFLGVTHIGGMVLGRRTAHRRERHIPYIASMDDSPNGSIDGLPALMMWYAVALHGNDGLRARAHAARRLAEYAADRLNQISWPAWRHPHAFTVVFPTPPAAIRQDWPIASDADGWSHLICMPGVTRAQVDAFVDAMTSVLHDLAYTTCQGVGRAG